MKYPALKELGLEIPTNLDELGTQQSCLIFHSNRVGNLDIPEIRLCTEGLLEIQEISNELWAEFEAACTARTRTKVIL